MSEYDPLSAIVYLLANLELVATLECLAEARSRNDLDQIRFLEAYLVGRLPQAPIDA